MIDAPEILKLAILAALISLAVWLAMSDNPRDERKENDK